MKRNLSLFAVAVVAIAATAVLAQSANAPTPAAGQSGLNPNSANGSGMQISTGTVTQYAAGQRIAVKLDGGQELALDLQRDVRVDGSVAVGQLAAIMWMTDNAGNKRVTSITAAPGPGDSGRSTLEANYAGMSGTPKATTPGRDLTPGPMTTPTPAPTPKPTPRPKSR